MRRYIFLAILGGMILSNCGCLLNIWSADPVQRSHELLVVSENLRVVQEEWERIWLIDQPSHLTPFRVHGGVAN